MQNLCCENEIFLHENTNRVHINGFALSLALKQRFEETLKWPFLSTLTHMEIRSTCNCV